MADGALDEAALGAILDEASQGDLPAPVVLMRLLAEASESERAEAALRAALAGAEGAARERLRAVRRLWDENPQAWGLVRSVLGGLDHEEPAASAEEGIARWAALFDRAVELSPEASVALYSLGNPALLGAASAEIVERLREWGVIGRDRDLLDLGCGIGRLCEALAPHMRRVTGIDISGEMIEAARRRCAGLPNVRLLQTAGRDLASFPDASFDLVLAADSFPYLVLSGMGLAERHVAEAARVLRPGGDLVILNFSYRGNPDLDRADVTLFAKKAGFLSVREDPRAFQLWNGRAFHLRLGTA